MLVEAELDLVIAMLELPANPSFTKTRQRPLAFLSQAREDLRGCVSDPPRLPWPRATSAAPVPTAAPRGTADPYAAAFLADGHGGSFASALRETEALAAEAADGQGNSKSGQQGSEGLGVSATPRLRGACCTPSRC